MKHIVTLTASLELVIADNDRRLCWQFPLIVMFWQQWNLPERVYLAVLDGARWLDGWIPNGETWRGLVTGGEYWRLMI